MKTIRVPCVRFADGRGVVEDVDGRLLPVSGPLEIVGRRLCVVATAVGNLPAPVRLVQFRDRRAFLPAADLIDVPDFQLRAA